MDKICIVEGCNNSHWSNGYCRKHDDQVRRTGKVLTYTRLCPNKIIEANEIAYIILCDTYGNEKAKAIIDTSDLPLAKQHKWYLSKSGYAVTRLNKNKQIHLHRLILSLKDGMVTDHINGNPLDNRRLNLRQCTQEQNMMNTKLRELNKYGCKGIKFDKRRNNWSARITVNKRDIYLGTFLNIEEAITTRKRAEILYFGEFSRLVVSEIDNKLRVEGR